jgi:Tol biopolymer transport system component
MLPIGGGEPRVLQATPAYEGGAQFSPDGKWLTYVSNTSTRMEVHLRPLDGPDRYQVSTTGGLGALWSRDGKRIFFRNGTRFQVVDVDTTGPKPRLSTPRLLFERRYSFGPNLTIPNYSMSADSTAFLLVSPGGGYLNLVFNWLASSGR